MAGLKGGIKVISLYDPETGDTVQLNSIAADSEYAADPIPTETTTGQAYGGKNHTLTINFFDQDSGALSQLQQWTEDDTPVCAVGAGGQSFLLWYEPVTMLFNRGKNLNARDGAMVNNVVLDFPGETTKIQTGINLADIYLKSQGQASGWQDVSGDDKPDGYQTFFTSGDGWAGGLYGFTTSTSDDSTLWVLIPFPIEGVALTGSVNIVTAASDGASTSFVRIQSREFVGDLISASSQAYSAAGRPSVTHVTQPNVFGIRFIPTVVESADSPTQVDISFPALRIDGRDSYVNH